MTGPQLAVTKNGRAASYWAISALAGPGRLRGPSRWDGCGCWAGLVKWAGWCGDAAARLGRRFGLVGWLGKPAGVSGPASGDGLGELSSFSN
jgi:hypothetical protein